MKSLARFALRTAGLEQIGVFYGWSAISGWKKSLKSKAPVDNSGEPLPWYCYPFIHFLNQRLEELDATELRVFEYGSGNSTLWWSKRVAHVTSVEDHNEWYDRIIQQKPDNVSYNLAAGKPDYIQCVAHQDVDFQIIIVDGSHREDCINVALNKLTDDGVVILDNSELDSVQKGIATLKTEGFRQIEFFGLGPVNGHPWGTSVFYRANNILHI